MATLAEVLRQAGYVTPQGQVVGPRTDLAQKLKSYVMNIPQNAAQNLANQRADIDVALTMGDKGIQIGDRAAFERQMAEVPNLMGSVNLPRKDLIAKQIDELQSTGRAATGGQIAESNGYFYKGGQFLPTTTAEPGKWKIGKKWVTSSRELIEPGVLANTPTPFSRGILGLVKDYTDYDKSGNLIIKQGPKVMQVKDGMQEYVPVSLETVFTPGVKGVLNKEPITLGELIDAYNKGQRWFDVQPNAVTITTK